MWKDKSFEPSPSRTYVAICNRANFDGHYFRKFVLPTHGEVEGRTETECHNGRWCDTGRWVAESYTPIYHNTCSQASWYFLNVLNFHACIEGCIPWEQYQDLKDQDEENQKHREEMKHLSNQP